MNTSKPLIIVGLGNPGSKYIGARHNTGFMAVDFLASTDAIWKSEHLSLIAKQDVKMPDGTKVKIIFVKPQTFMNLSGNAVRAVMAFYKAPLENLFVIHDDMDLKVGDMRIKIGGGSAGHNGIKNIDEAVGREYTRIRIGVGHPRDIGLMMDPADWVLGKFSDDEMQKIKSTITEIKII